LNKAEAIKKIHFDLSGLRTRSCFASTQLSNIEPNQWHKLKLQFKGATITGLVDGKPVLTATDTLYTARMAGLLAAKVNKTLSMPYFDNVLINRIDGAVPQSSTAMDGQVPIY
jgi:galactosylceramidase